MQKKLSTLEVAKQAGVHKDTLLRWLRAGLVPEPGRDRKGWRVFTENEANKIANFARQESFHRITTVKISHEMTINSTPLEKLQKIDWDFKEAKTDYLTHSIHPYPAKFIPQIPNALIQELSSVGDTVLDIFCGSGTTLAEALLLKRHVIGIDANPLACLISKAKVLRLTDEDEQCLREFENRLGNFIAGYLPNQINLFDIQIYSNLPIEYPTYPQIEFWFEPFVIEELAILKSFCLALPTETARTLALTVFSSIVINVSKQDSDTRYVRRSKKIVSGDTFRRFHRAFGQAITKALEFTDASESRFTCDIYQANILQPPNLKNQVDLMVCSPPYPNAYSYHLYHMTRMLWLDMNQVAFKQEEIGSHRKYSRKGNSAATVETFKSELHTILRWLRNTIKPNGYACFVVGNSTISGKVIQNDELLIGIAGNEGFSFEGLLIREMQATKKAFNPSIGKIKQEKIVVLRNVGGQNG